MWHNHSASGKRQPARGPGAGDLPLPSDDGLNLEGWLLTPPPPRGTVLLFHGYAAPRSSLLTEAGEFRDLGYAAGLIDFRGSGGSDGDTTTLGYDEARDVAAAVRHVRNLGLPRPLILYGQSMGAAAVLRSIAVLDVQPDAVIVESVFARLLDAVRNRFDLMGVPSFPGAELLMFWGGRQAGFSAFSHNPQEYARSCDCPALVLNGSADQHARLEEGQSIYASLPGQKEMVIFDGAGHTSLCRAAPAQWHDAVQRFLTKVSRDFR